MRHLIYFIVLVIMYGCEQDLPYADTGIHCLHDTQAYNLGIGKWNKDTVNYYIQDYPEFQKEQYESSIIRAASFWQEPTGLIIQRTEEKNNADILVKIDEIDGIGGILGRTNPPPIDEHSLYPINIWFDYWDVATVEGRTKFDFFQLRCMSLDTVLASGTQILNLHSCTENIRKGQVFLPMMCWPQR